MLSKLFGRPPKVRGIKLLHTLADRAFNALASGAIEDVYRASLIGGVVGAEGMLKVDPKMVSLWGRGDSTKAARLLEVWVSTVAVHLLQNEPNQDEVTRGIAKGLATVVFRSDEAVGLTELQAYQIQRKADDQIRAEGGVALYGHTLIYLRCLRALGQPLDFGTFPVPLRSVSELLSKGLVEDAGRPETILGIAMVLAESATLARSAFDAH